MGGDLAFGCPKPPAGDVICAGPVMQHRHVAEGATRGSRTVVTCLAFSETGSHVQRNSMLPRLGGAAGGRGRGDLVEQ